MAETFFYTHPDDNVAPGATASVETGTVVVEYEAIYLTDLSDMNRQRPTMIAETTGAFMLAYAAAQKHALFVLWHNGKSNLAGVTLQANATNAWSSPSLSVPLSIPAKRGDGSTEKVFVDLRATSGFLTGYKFWRVRFATANDVPLGLKVLAFDRIRQLSVDVAFGVRKPTNRPSLNLGTEIDPRGWTYDLQVGPRQLRGHLNNITGDDLSLVQTWFDASGSGGLTLLVPEPEDATTGAWLCRWLTVGDGLVVTTLDPSYDSQDTYNLDIQFEEVTAGGPEWT